MDTATRGLEIRAAGLSDRGLKRAHNEDCLSVVPDMGLFIVADGMGGHSAGEVASRRAIERIVEYLRQEGEPETEDDTAPQLFDPKLSLHENRISAAVRLANRDVHKLAEEHSEFQGMGTTVVGMLFDAANSKAAIAHVGDSRCYRVRNGEIQLLTLDHSWVNEQLQRKIITPEEAKNHRWRNVITRALGHRPDVEVDVQSEELKPHDLYLLCSDGLSGLLDDQDLKRIMLSNPDLEDCAQELIRAANEAGGHDNITIILIRILESPK
ncbi:MAG: Stp1/IreP family PP2C-type Ser/Thr phosphatase [Candidatus Sumerlaeia bacterium]|nr:Stp1/IreP family PP2C-type Ser/Thr phosphatase [Candidatus Sumerlaeia bacterium]